MHVLFSGMNYACKIMYTVCDCVNKAGCFVYLFVVSKWHKLNNVSLSHF